MLAEAADPGRIIGVGIRGRSGTGQRIQTHPRHESRACAGVHQHPGFDDHQILVLVSQQLPAAQTCRAIVVPHQEPAVQWYGLPHLSQQAIQLTQLVVAAAPGALQAFAAHSQPAPNAWSEDAPGLATRSGGDDASRHAGTSLAHRAGTA